VNYKEGLYRFCLNWVKLMWTNFYSTDIWNCEDYKFLEQILSNDQAYLNEIEHIYIYLKMNL
jgi:hypothetical protein